MKSITTTELRRGLADHLLAINAGEIIHVTHYDRAAAVVVSAGWYERAARILAWNDSADADGNPQNIGISE